MSLTLSPLEIACGYPLESSGPTRVRRPRATESPRAALEAEILSGLRVGERSSVSFSGGRDSSLILAVACHVARREGFPDPLPVTMRHDSVESDESDWQDLVLDHLGVADRAVVDISDRMDLLSVAATSVLGLHGILCPPNAYLHLPMVAEAPPGTMFTGAGGDEVLGTPAGRLARVLFGDQSWTSRDALRLLAALAPFPARAWRKGRSTGRRLPWLTVEANDQLERDVGRADAMTRVRWDVDAVRYAQSRSVVLGRSALATIGQVHETPVASPLLGSRFVEAFATHTGPSGPRDRTDSMRLLAADLLPPEVVERRTKATFGGVVWGPRFREMAQRWQPEDLAPAVRRLVVPDRLRQEWEDEEPHYATMLLAQHSWLNRSLTA